MNVLITGHQGYIGPVLVKNIKERGHYTIGLDIGYFKDCLDSDDTLEIPDREIKKDIRDITSQDLDNVHAIVHLSAISNDPMGQLNPRITEDINFKASIRLAELAKLKGINRFIMASSCSIYGAADYSKALNETAEFNPVSAYAHSKVNTECTLSTMADNNFSPVYLRNATAYGVSPRMRFDLVLSNLMAWAKTTGVVKIMSDGTPWRPLVHIEDISNAICAALEAPRDSIHNEAFNIGRNDSNYRIVEIANVVAETLGNVKVEITGNTSGDTRSYKVNFDKALKYLPGFKPEWTLEKGCEELLEWFNKNRAISNIIESRKYIRLKQLEFLIESGKVDSELRPVDGIL